MAAKKEFGEGAVFTITNYIWWFLLSNLYFGIMNIPFIFVFFGSSMEGTSGLNLLLVLSLIPSGPALVALLSTMGKVVREKDADVTRDFFRAYKRNFFEALSYWSGILIVLSILYIDILYFNTKPQLILLKYALMGIGLIIISISFYMLAIISRFYLKGKDVIKISLYYAVKKIHITILNWGFLIGLFAILMKVSNAIFILMGWSIFAFLIMFNMKSVLAEIEEKYIKVETDI